MKINPKEDQAYLKALNQISYRPRSTFEIKTFLKRREFSPEIIDKTIKKLTRQGYLDDAKFAQTFVASYKTKKGPLLIKAKLSSLGVEPSVIETTLNSFYSSQEIITTAQTLLQKKHFDLSDPKQRHKARNLLLRHGFPTSTIQKIID